MVKAYLNISVRIYTDETNPEGEYTRTIKVRQMKLCTPQDFEAYPLESQIYMARVSYVNSLCVDY